MKCIHNIQGPILDNRWGQGCRLTEVYGVNDLNFSQKSCKKSPVT